MKKRQFILGLVLLLSSAVLWGQSAPDVTLNSATFPVWGLNAVPVPGASLQIVGASGQATWCYWASANFQIGSVISSLGCISNAPNTLSVSNYVTIFPLAYPPGVVTVDILATPLNISPTGACACAVTTGLTSGSTNQTSNTTSAYTVSILNPSSFNLVMRNEVVSSATTHLLLRNAAGSLVCDMSTGCGSGSGLSGMTAGQVPIAATSTTVTSSKAIQGTDTKLLSSGTVSGTGASLCTDASGGATTSGCTAGSGFPVTTAQVVSGNGSLSPTSTGTAAQNIANQLWAPVILPPVVTMSTSGGTMSSTFSVTVALAYVNASGTSALGMPTWGTTASFGCTIGTSCNLTVTPPTLPSGYTGYTVYAFYTGSAGININNVTSQSGCVNITSSCTIAGVTTGSTPLTVPASYLTPTGLASNCPNGVVPFIFGPGTNGNYNAAAGWDVSNNNVVTNTGFLTFCQHLYVNDRGTTQPQGDNALLVVDHTAGVGTSAGNQDRALWVSNATPAGDSATRYALEGIQAELDFNCSGCTINGSPDGEVSTISGQMADNHVGAIGNPAFGTLAGRFTYFREAGAGSYSSCNYCAGAINATAQNNSTASGANNDLYGIKATCSEQSGAASFVSCAGGIFGTSGTWTNTYDIIAVDSGAGANTNFNILSLAGNEEQGHNNLNGKTYLMHIAAANLNPTYAQTNPTCSFASGGGSGASCAIRAGSTDSLGRMVLTTGTGPSGTITATVTYHTPFGSPVTDTSCQFTMQNNGGTWDGLANPVITAHSTSAVTVQVTNGVTPTALTASTTYDVNYTCWGN